MDYENEHEHDEMEAEIKDDRGNKNVKGDKAFERLHQSLNNSLLVKIHKTKK
ncbi:hypothetical protein GNT69_12885 [Bacillus sp. B15-48]|nr:hypothetical protein [Bacillus sp. B15-48]